MNFILIAVVVAALFAFSSCKRDFERVRDVHGEYTTYGISKNKKRIYASYHAPFAYPTFRWSRVKGVNAKEFIALSYSFGKDDKQVFYDGRAIAGFRGFSADTFLKGEIDVESFVVDEKEFPKDKNHVYLMLPSGGELMSIEGANPETFDGMDGNGLARDGKHYFYWEKKLDIADYNSFIFFPGNPAYGKDKHHVYMIWKDHYNDVQMAIIENANPDTFEVVEIYFETTNTNWAKDDKHYFYRGKQHTIDYKSFEIIYGGIVIDKNHVYRYGEITEKTVEEAKAESEARFKRNNPSAEVQ